LPLQAEKSLLLSSSPAWVLPSIEELPAGFMAMPFATQEMALFMPADVLMAWTDPEQPASLHKTHPMLEGLLPSSPKAKWHVGQYSTLNPAQEPDFLSLVRKGVQAIESGAMQKVVLSRQAPAPISADLHPLDLFERLCTLYPNAFVSLISDPEVGTWAGATPEILVSIDRKGIFRTVSLAGTQARSNAERLSDALWRQKEIEEQALVSRYIINCFKRIRLREFEELGPKTVQAGALMHLRTDFVVDIKAVKFPNLGTVMLDLLHPTSAVCGMPKKASYQFILENEGYERGLYSGYLGPVNVMGETHQFVNLRCLQLRQQEAWLYAGAGITQDSVPEREWQETAMKMGIVAQALI
jgi:isochorismate synthase